MIEPSLGLEEVILLLVILMQEEAYAIYIAEEYKQINNNNISFPAVHTILKRLEKKGFFGSQLGGSRNTQGGRRRKLHVATNDGFQMARKKNCIIQTLTNLL